MRPDDAPTSVSSAPAGDGSARVAVHCAFSAGSAVMRRSEGELPPATSVDPTGVAPEPAPRLPATFRASCAPDARFVVEPGSWTLDVSQLDVGNRSTSKTLELQPGENLSLTFEQKDLAVPNVGGGCCHCPFVAVYDPRTDGYRPAFEVLVDRKGVERAGVDRIPLRVDAHEGRIRLRIRELESEITTLASVALETQSGATMRQLDPPSLPRLLRRGDELVLEFATAAGEPAEGERAVTLVIGGHYVPVP